MSDSLRYPRGVRPASPTARRRERLVLDHWLAEARAYGYYEVGLPALAFADVYQRHHNAAAERIYEFEDRGGRRLALVSDALIAWLHAVHTMSTDELTEHRVSYVCPVFRYRKARRRAFHQMGLGYLVADPCHRTHPDLVLRELIGALDRFALSLDTVFRITLAAPGLWPRLLSRTERRLDLPLGRLGRDELAALLRTLALPPWVADAVHRTAVPVAELDRRVRQAAGAEAPELRFLAAELGRLHALAVDVCTRRPRLEVAVDLGDLHAAEFHSGIGLQIYTRSGVRVGDGGEYSAFASTLLGRNVTCCSLVFGMERLAENLEMQIPMPDVMVAALLPRRETDFKTVEAAEDLADRLRSYGGRAVLHTSGRNLPQVLRAAQHLGVRALFLLGARELAGQVVLFQDLAASRPATYLPLADAVAIGVRLSAPGGPIRSERGDWNDRSYPRMGQQADPGIYRPGQ